MGVKYVLHHVAQRMSTPVPIQGDLRRIITFTLVTNVVAIPFLRFVPSLVGDVYPVSSDGFFVGFTADMVNFLLRLSYHLSYYLLVPNILSLVMAVIVLLISRGMKRPVSKPVHWLGWLAAFPSGITVVSAAVIAILFIAIVVIAIIIWGIIFALYILFIIFFFVELARERERG